MSGSPVYIDGRLIGAVSYSIGAFFEGADRGHHADCGDEGRDRAAAARRQRRRRAPRAARDAEAITSALRAAYARLGTVQQRPADVAVDRLALGRGGADRRDAASDRDAVDDERLRVGDASI